MKFLIALPFLSVLLIGCDSASNALSLNPNLLKDRQMQTRSFETADERKMLLATSGLLQDLGFSLDESETKLGLIVASKERDATNAAQVSAAVFIAAMGNSQAQIEKMQRIRASVVTSKLNQNKVTVRVTFQRVVFDQYGGITRTEFLNEPEMYQGFFEKLSKAVFLEANQI